MMKYYYNFLIFKFCSIFIHFFSLFIFGFRLLGVYFLHFFFFRVLRYIFIFILFVLKKLYHFSGSKNIRESVYISDNLGNFSVNQEAIAGGLIPFFYAQNLAKTVPLSNFFQPLDDFFIFISRRTIFLLISRLEQYKRLFRFLNSISYLDKIFLSFSFNSKRRLFLRIKDFLKESNGRLLSLALFRSTAFFLRDYLHFFLSSLFFYFTSIFRCLRYYFFSGFRIFHNLVVYSLLATFSLYVQGRIAFVRYFLKINDTFDKFSSFLCWFLVFCLRSLFLFFTIPSIFISYFFVCIISLFFFIDSVFLKKNPWIRQRYPVILSKRFPQILGILDHFSFSNSSLFNDFSFRSHHDLLELQMSVGISRISFIKDFLVFLFDVARWFYLIYVRSIFSSGYNEHVHIETFELRLPVSKNHWFFDFFSFVRVLIILVMIPFIIFFLVFIIKNISFVMFLFFSGIFFVIYVCFSYILKLEFSKVYNLFLHTIILNLYLQKLMRFSLGFNSPSQEAMLFLDQLFNKKRRYYIYRYFLFSEATDEFFSKFIEIKEAFFSYFKSLFLVIKLSYNFDVLHTSTLVQFLRSLSVLNVFIYSFFKIFFKVHFFRLGVFFIPFIYFLNNLIFSFFFFLFFFECLLQIILWFLLKVAIVIFVSPLFISNFYYIQSFLFFIYILSSLLILFVSLFVYYIYQYVFFSYFSRKRLFGFLHILGIVFSTFSNLSIKLDYPTIIKYWYNRFLFTSEELYVFFQSRLRSIIFPLPLLNYFLQLFNSTYQGKPILKKAKMLKELKYIFFSPSLNTDAREKKRLLLKNLLSQQIFMSQYKFHDFYLGDFFFHRFLIRRRLSDFKSTYWKSSWLWFLNYSLLRNLVTFLKKSYPCVFLSFRINLPRSEFTKLQFHLDSLTLNNYFFNRAVYFTYFFSFLIFLFFMYFFSYSFFVPQSLICSFILTVFLFHFIFFFSFLRYISLSNKSSSYLLLSVFKPIKLNLFVFLLNKLPFLFLFFSPYKVNILRSSNLRIILFFINYKRNIKASVEDIIIDFLRLVFYLFCFVFSYVKSLFFFFNFFSPFYFFGYNIKGLDTFKLSFETLDLNFYMLIFKNGPLFFFIFAFFYLVIFSFLLYLIYYSLLFFCFNRNDPTFWLLRWLVLNLSFGPYFFFLPNVYEPVTYSKFMPTINVRSFYSEMQILACKNSILLSIINRFF